MDARIIGQLDQFDRALDTLIESISTSNPSVAAAEQLVMSDDAIAESVKQLAIHQSHYARIQSLHAEAESLDIQIKDRFRDLVRCREELISVPAAAVSADSHEVSADEVLRMGNRISKFTIPPTSRVVVPKTPIKTEVEAGTGTINGIAVSQAHSPLQQDVKNDTDKDNGVYASLPLDTRSYLEERDRHLREVWKSHPSDNVVRSGLLMDIQQMLDRGLDPANLTVEQRDAEAERLAEEEEQRRQKEADEERKRRESVKASVQPRPVPAQQAQPQEDTGYDLFDPDED